MRAIIPPRPTTSPTSSQWLAVVVRAKVVHAPELATRLGAHDASDEVAGPDHESGSLAIARAWRSSPCPSPSSRALALRLTAVPTAATPFHGTRMTSAPSRPAPNTRRPMPSQGSREPTVECPRPAEDRVQPRRITEIAGELEVVHSSAPPTFDVDELVVEDAIDEVHVRGYPDGHPAPPWVISMSGIAATATTTMIAKNSQPRALPRIPLTCSPMNVGSRATSNTGR